MPSTTLRCPLCQFPLERFADPRPSLRCDNGHRFDAAKQGYFNFLTGKGTNFVEDTAPMVAARAAFLEAGHYLPLAEAIIAAARLPEDRAPLHLLDAGAGTGYYLGQLLRAAGSRAVDAVALDISRYAMRRAAKLPSTTALVWDVWRTLPTADASRQVVLNCFAPHNPAEFRRVLSPGGTCVVVTALPTHLQEIRQELQMLGIAPDKEEQLVARFAGAGLELLDSRELSYPMELDPTALYNLAFMGPAGHHLDEQALAATVERLGPRRVTAAFGIYSFG
ncbi:putative RNA methyltransferase [Glutamicibacter creatinolyticus]|uniref:putative RNA methyltransferase n=1 Tax=Glutamicibacter creatinolyticus TaxID=162496 RepID=UPI003217DC95